MITRIFLNQNYKSRPVWWERKDGKKVNNKNHTFPSTAPKRWRRRVTVLIAAGALSWSIVSTAPVWAEDKSVAEEILDILKDKGDISDQQYDTLKKKAEAEKKAQEPEWNFYWKNRFILESKDKQFRLDFGGRLTLDAGYIGADKTIEAAFPNETGWGTEIRQGRLFFEGLVYDAFEFKTEYDFATGGFFTDVYMGFRKIPGIETLRFGHFKEPVSLEQLTSRKYITFMERSLPDSAFVPSRNMGVMVFSNAFDERMTWSAGAFQETDGNAFSFNDFSDWNLSARVTGLPWFVDKKKLLHLGLSYSHKFGNEGETTRPYSSPPESTISLNRLVNTGALLYQDVDLVNPEIALVYGPFSFQGEYYYNMVNSTPDNDPVFSGYYAMVSYFVTGESRSYNPYWGTFTRIKPTRNFHPTKGGLGAIELGLRYSYLNLNYEDIQGGVERDWTFGINWYATPNTRFTFNYIRGNVEDRTTGAAIPDGDVDILQGRILLDF